MKRHRRHHQHDPDLEAAYTRRRFLVASALAAVPLSAWWVAGSSSETSGSGDGQIARPSPTQPIAPTTAPTPTTAPELVTGGSTSVSSTSTVPALDHDLVEGIVDPKVGAMQQRLTDLAFDPGPVDDYYGAATIRSVWAFQKLVMGVAREQADGVVTPEIWDRMHGRVEITPRRTPGGTHLEIYLPEQVAVLFTDGRPRVVSHVSSGEGIEWCDEVTVDLDDGTTETKGICGRSVTPGGVYHFERKVEGWRNAKLGRLYKPTYFNYGIAIHGAGNVPNYPASRGCVRFPMHIAEYIQDLVEIGDDVYVFDGVEEPEHYGAQPMIFDWADPDYTTTTTSTTTTSTTTPPATTTSTVPEPATTTTHPHPSTTTSIATTSMPSTTVPED
jgi:peptidoglycan hydrolase-like protein with peptidoglycan-binding domain